MTKKKSGIFACVLLLIVLVLGLSSVTLASGDEADATFDITIDIIQPLEIVVNEHMEFGTVYAGVEELLEEAAEFTITGEDAEISLDFPATATLTSDTTADEISVALSDSLGGGTATITSGVLYVAIYGEIASGELDVDPATYEGTETVTVYYAD